MRSSLILGGGLFLTGLAAGAAWTSWALTPARLDIRQGTTLVSFLPEAVMSLAYMTPAGITTAQRSNANARFQVLSTFADGRPVQRCNVSANMEGRLDKLATLTARRSLTLGQRENQFPVQLGVIEVRDEVIGEPSGPALVFTNQNKTAVAIILDGRAAEVTLQAADLDWMATACSRLSPKPGPT